MLPPKKSIETHSYYGVVTKEQSLARAFPDNALSARRKVTNAERVTAPEQCEIGVRRFTMVLASSPPYPWDSR